MSIIIKLQKRLISWLAAKPHYSDDDLFMYIISYAATFFCILVHIALLALGLWFDENLITYFNTFSLTVYVILFICLLRGRYRLVTLLLSLEVVIYTTTVSSLTGYQNLTIMYFMLVIILQIVMPHRSMSMRIGVGVVLLCCITFSLWHGLETPIYPFSSPLERVLTICNAYITFLGCATELLLSNLIHKMVAQISAARISELEGQANTDPLTGLYNRRYAEKFFKLLPKSNRPATVAMLDVDDFKQINDRYGHPAGDIILQVLATHLKNSLRKTDVVFRWGGEEFLLVMNNVDLATSYRILDSLRQRLSVNDITLPEGDTVRITVTIGLAALDPTNPAASIENSDQKLYEGKRDGKNMVVT